ncbi:unnamed protein product [Rhizophagus irregularis]|uniref:Uncharacterized protein n=1 Tax=Rhizophagus irregularis TaxID=588596 RepID=A0A915YVA8_9GLOM|nr:unnamed protein product [Rhizophagus irregularis]
MNLVTRYEPSEETSSKSTELYLPTDICQIIIGDLFWSRISQLAILIKPYCGAFGKLQIDKAQLYDVALSFGYFIKFWEQNTDQFLKHESEKIKVNIAPPIIESAGEQETGNTEQNEAERILEDLQETSDYIITEQDWIECLNEWNELLMKEEKAQNLDVTKESLNCSDNDLLNSYIYPPYY